MGCTLYPELVKQSRATGQESRTETSLECNRRLVVPHDPQIATQIHRECGEQLRSHRALADELQTKFVNQDAGEDTRSGADRPPRQDQVSSSRSRAPVVVPANDGHLAKILASRERKLQPTGGILFFASGGKFHQHEFDREFKPVPP